MLKNTHTKLITLTKIHSNKLKKMPKKLKNDFGPLPHVENLSQKNQKLGV
jgi:hypothetical protein